MKYPPQVIRVRGRALEPPGRACVYERVDVRRRCARRSLDPSLPLEAGGWAAGDCSEPLQSAAPGTCADHVSRQVNYGANL